LFFRSSEWIPNKDDLKGVASSQAGLDVLFVVDSCCSPVSQGPMPAKGARVEFVAASTRQDPTNSRTASDGRTFTQHWCAAFNKLLDTGKPFVSEDINRTIDSDSRLKQFPSLFVLREGWDLPITFSSHNNAIESSLPSELTSQTIATVFYVKEKPDSPSVKQLIEYFNNAPFPITVLGTVPVSGTLLLVSMPMFLQELLIVPGVAFLLEDH